MEIIYQKILEKNKVIKGSSFENEGMTIEKIIILENKYNNGNQFPKAFREYLYLAGEFNNLGFDDYALGLDEFQNTVKDSLQYCKFTVEQPYIAFDGGDEYLIIFLNTTEENPEVSILSPYGAKEKRFPLIRPTGFKFKELVNEYIGRINN